MAVPSFLLIGYFWLSPAPVSNCNNTTITKCKTRVAKPLPH